MDLWQTCNQSMTRVSRSLPYEQISFRFSWNFLPKPFAFSRTVNIDSVSVLYPNEVPEFQTMCMLFFLILIHCLSKLPPFSCTFTCVVTISSLLSLLLCIIQKFSSCINSLHVSAVEGVRAGKWTNEIVNDSIRITFTFLHCKGEAGGHQPFPQPPITLREFDCTHTQDFVHLPPCSSLMPNLCFVGGSSTWRFTHPRVGDHFRGKRLRKHLVVPLQKIFHWYVKISSELLTSGRFDREGEAAAAAPLLPPRPRRTPVWEPPLPFHL